MKRIIILLLTSIFVFCGCASTRLTPEEKAAEQARIAQAIQENLDARQYEIDVDMMYPRRGPSQRLTSPYSVKIDGGKIVSYLPYFGVAYSVPYGGGKGLNFSGDISRYTELASGHKDRRQFQVQVTNDEDTYIYLITVFDNGRSDVRVICQQRDEITFTGEMKLQ